MSAAEEAAAGAARAGGGPGRAGLGAQPAPVPDFSVAAPAPLPSDAVEPELRRSRLPPVKPPRASAPGTAAPRLPLIHLGMPAGLTEPAGAAPPAGVSASGPVSMAPAGTLPVRVEGAALALGAVTKAPVSVCVESTASQPPRPPVGTVVTKVAPVSALPKLSSGPPLPAPQLVAVKAPNTTTIQLPANLQLPPGMSVPSSSFPIGPASGDTGNVAPPDSASLLLALGKKKKKKKSAQRTFPNQLCRAVIWLYR